MISSAVRVGFEQRARPHFQGCCMNNINNAISANPGRGMVVIVTIIWTSNSSNNSHTSDNIQPSSGPLRTILPRITY